MDIVIFAMTVFMLTSILDSYINRKRHSNAEKNIARIDFELTELRIDHNQLDQYVHNDIKNTLDL